jgi:ubiquinone/menaquinone biosynthesis C-methylase UbiE
VLKEECQLSEASVIADIGSGTGILTELFLRNGNRVFAVEPNDAMRRAAERLLARYDSFRSVAGRAEASGLEDRSVDFVTAAQAFHWFDRDLARREFLRVLRPGGWVVLVWNERDTESSPFLVAYERFLEQFGTDYRQVDHRRVDSESLAAFYRPGAFQSKEFPNRQELDLEGLKGRVLSTSYLPSAEHPNFEPMVAELSRLFRDYAEGGRVVFEYRTLLHWGKLELEEAGQHGSYG